jgi:hypothetical protein
MYVCLVYMFVYMSTMYTVYTVYGLHVYSLHVCTENGVRCQCTVCGIRRMAPTLVELSLYFSVYSRI